MTPSHTCPWPDHSSFVAKNELSIPIPYLNEKTGITKERYHHILDKIEKIYKPIVKARGRELRILRLWENERVNAGAMQVYNIWIVKIFGGTGPPSPHDRRPLGLCGLP